MTSFQRTALSLSLVLLIWGCGASRQTAVVVDAPERETATIQERPAHQSEDEPDAQSPADPSNATTDVLVGRFDGGKMWTFEAPPVAYFEEAYGFEADTAWLNKARLGALRFSTFCSASFVSPHGLVMTNHHCGRESVTAVSKDEEDLLENGFYASTLSDEREVKDLFVEQLIAIEDVTDKIYANPPRNATPAQAAEARERRATNIAARMTNEVAAGDSTIRVEVVALYQGGRYSAYTFKKYNDVRLVMAPELALGFFGGDPDNFTFPRYTLDMTFFRVYEEDKPLSSPHYFRWNTEGGKIGDPVFVVGNPGTTSRLSTHSQLVFERDHQLPHQLAALEKRAAILKAYMDSNPEETDTFDLENTYFSINNSIKATGGQYHGLQDEGLMARKMQAEYMLKEAIDADPELKSMYGSVLRDIEIMQRSKEASARTAAAFAFFGSEEIASHILTRIVYGYFHGFMTQRAAFYDPEQITEIRDEGLAIKDWPADLEKSFIEARFQELVHYLGPYHPVVSSLFKELTPEALADSLVSQTALADSAGFAGLLEGNYLKSGDYSVQVAEALVPLFLSLGQEVENFETEEQTKNAALSRARYAVYGADIPPDATFSLRISDGVIASYAYNGTRAPAFTTLFGLYDHYYGYTGKDAWELPDRWLDPPADLDLSTPINLVSTNDITGGNSGSPLLNQSLEVVGLVFDSNIEALPNEYLYLDTAGRTVSVDVRGMLEVLDDIYNAERMVQELVSGTLSEEVPSNDDTP